MDTEDEDLFSDSTTTLDTPVNVALGHVMSRAFVLKQVAGPGAPREIVLTRDRLVIGRSKRVDIVIDSPELSRRHVLLERDGHEFVIRDLDSRNGLYLDRVKIHSAVLRGGDTLQIGNVTFVFLEGF